MSFLKTLFGNGLTYLSLIGASVALAQDPFIPAWSSYVGGTYDVDDVYAAAVDSATNSYIGGSLGSGEIQSDPSVVVTDPYGYQGSQDAFVAKVTASGALAWYICLGAEENDRVRGLAVGPNDRVYAAGYSERTDILNEDGGTNACLWSVNRSTGANDWTVTIGAFNGASRFTAVAVDTNGYIYAVGTTSVTGLALNVSGYLVNGTNYGTQLKGDLDACVLKVAPNGSIVWFHYLGGTNADVATACAVGPDGSVYVAGETRSPGWVSTPSGTPGPANKDGFLVKLSADGTHIWSTFLGGSADDAVNALAKDPTSSALFLGGTTASTTFLANSTRLNSYAGGSDGFVVKLTDSGTTFTNTWCRFLGGSASERVTSLARQSDGKVVAGGATASGGWLTQTGGSVFSGVQDGFLCTLDSAGDVAVSAYIGGASNDEVRALAPTPNSMLAAGSTRSPDWVSGGFWTAWNKEDLFGITGVFGFVGKWLSEPGVPAAVTDDPDDLTVQEGQPAAFRVAAAGTAPLTYRWFRNGVPATGLTSNTYVIAAAARTNNQDTYACLVSNAYGTATSQAARLTVISNGTLTVTLAPAAAVSQGARWSLNSGVTWFTSGSSTNLAAGTYSVTFTNLTGWATPATLADVQVDSGATTSTSGVYTAILPSAARAITGTNVTVTVRAPAGISTWALVENLAPGLTPTSYTAGGTWNSSAHTLTFTGTEATTNTLSYTVSCVTSGIYTVSGTVTPQPANVPVAVTGDSRIIKVNLLRTINGTSVTITVYQLSASFIWSVYEYLPTSLTPTNITGPNANWDPASSTIDWYRKGVGQTLTYTVTGTPGSYTLSGEGQVTSSGMEPIFGDSVVTIPGAEIPPPNILSLVPLAGTNALALTFTSVAGQAYMIRTNATVAVTNLWFDCLSVTGADGTTVQPVPMSGPRLFYRVRVAQ